MIITNINIIKAEKIYLEEINIQFHGVKNILIESKNNNFETIKLLGNYSIKLKENNKIFEGLNTILLCEGILDRIKSTTGMISDKMKLYRDQLVGWLSDIKFSYLNPFYIAITKLCKKLFGFGPEILKSIWKFVESLFYKVGIELKADSRLETEMKTLSEFLKNQKLELNNLHTQQEQDQDKLKNIIIFIIKSHNDAIAIKEGMQNSLLNKIYAAGKNLRGDTVISACIIIAILSFIVFKGGALLGISIGIPALIQNLFAILSKKGLGGITDIPELIISSFLGSSSILVTFLCYFVGYTLIDRFFTLFSGQSIIQYFFTGKDFKFDFGIGDLGDCEKEYFKKNPEQLKNILKFISKDLKEEISKEKIDIEKIKTILDFSYQISYRSEFKIIDFTAQDCLYSAELNAIENNDSGSFTDAEKNFDADTKENIDSWLKRFPDTFDKKIDGIEFDDKKIIKILIKKLVINSITNLDDFWKFFEKIQDDKAELDKLLRIMRFLVVLNKNKSIKFSNIEKLYDKLNSSNLIGKIEFLHYKIHQNSGGLDKNSIKVLNYFLDYMTFKDINNKEVNLKIFNRLLHMDPKYLVKALLDNKKYIEIDDNGNVVINNTDLKVMYTKYIEARESMTSRKINTSYIEGIKKAREEVKNKKNEEPFQHNIGAEGQRN